MAPSTRDPRQTEAGSGSETTYKQMIRMGKLITDNSEDNENSPSLQLERRLSLRNIFKLCCPTRPLEADK